MRGLDMINQLDDFQRYTLIAIPPPNDTNPSNRTYGNKLFMKLSLSLTEICKASDRKKNEIRTLSANIPIIIKAFDKLIIRSISYYHIISIHEPTVYKEKIQLNEPVRRQYQNQQ